MKKIKLWYTIVHERCEKMKIALINENSQVSKNSLILESLKKVCDQKGYQVYNLGMTCETDKNLTYVQNGLLASILLNDGCIDFVVTGCGTGEGAMLALNSFPKVTCGLIETPTDAYLFSQINAGNAVSLPFAKGFGWGSEITLEYIFEKLFASAFGGGYPKERQEPEQRNKKILDEVKKVTHQDIMTILKTIDKQFLKETIDRPNFLDFYTSHAQNEEIAQFIKEIMK